MRKTVIVVSVACGLIGSAEAGKKKFKPAKHYAALFVTDNSWTYTVTATEDHYQDVSGDYVLVHDKTTTTTVTCKVTEAHVFRNGATSRITCAPALEDVGDTWIATARGLATLDWEAEEAHVGITKLPKRSQLAEILAARPRETDVNQEMDEGFLGTTIEKDHGAWCVTDSYTSIGERGSTKVCYDRLGIRGGEKVDENDDGPITKVVFTRQ